MKTIGKWFLLLSKRLYKKVSFLVLLALIPACVTVFTLTAKEESGFMRVVLSQRGSTDTQVVDRLLQENGAIVFSYAATPEEAELLVRAGKVDEAWIFPGDAFTEIREAYDGTRTPVVQIITREDGEMMYLSREKIPTALYEYCAKSYYLEYIRTNIPQLHTLDDEALLSYFDGVQVSEDFFTYRDPVPQNSTSPAKSYLTAPIRGLLAIFVLLGSMAATMFYMQDTVAGTFCLVKTQYRGLIALGSVMTATVHISAVALVSLLISSLAGNLLTELAILLLYALCCSAFCLLLKALLANIRSYCAVLPLLTVMMLGICPVFIDFRQISVLQHIFPPTYYINSIYDTKNLWYMAIYSAACLLLAWLLQKIKVAIQYRK